MSFGVVVFVWIRVVDDSFDHARTLAEFAGATVEVFAAPYNAARNESSIRCIAVSIRRNACLRNFVRSATLCNDYELAQRPATAVWKLPDGTKERA